MSVLEKTAADHQASPDEKRKAGSQAFFRLLKETKPPMALLVGAILLNIVSTLVGLVIPMFTKTWWMASP